MAIAAVSATYAADTETWSTVPVGAITVENPLLVDTIESIDTKHVNVVFNQPIIRESVRVRITKQNDDSNVRIESFTGSADNSTVQVILTDSIEADTAYKMTIVSAISEDGVIIKDGADGLKEFTTPVDLQEYSEEIPVIVELNAPSNPNAIIVAATGSSQTESTPTMVATNTGETETPSPSSTTEELPPAGANPLIYLAIAGSIAFILLIRRRHA